MSTNSISRGDGDPPTDRTGAFVCGRACENGSRCLRNVSYPHSVCHSHEPSDPVGTDSDKGQSRRRSLADGGHDRPVDGLSPSETADSRDDLFAILSNQRRRDVLVYLNEHGGTATLSELAVQVAAWENSTPEGEITSAERQRVYIPLYQTHLPKLAAYGVIEYDQSRGTIERTDRADQFDSYLREPDTPAGEQQDQGPPETDGSRALEELSLWYMGATAVLGTGTVGLAWLGIVPAMALLALSWFAIIGIYIVSTVRNGNALPSTGKAIE